MSMWFSKRNRRQAAKSADGLPVVSAVFAVANRKRLLVVAGSVLFAIAMVWLVLALLDRPVRRIEVTGQFLRVSPPQIEQAVLAFCGSDANAKRGFISLRLDALKAAVESLAWVDKVRIERRWPDGVHLTIIEQIPVARWGEHGLLNASGKLFLKDARYVSSELPQLNGPEGSQDQVARLYLDTYPRLAAIGLRLTRVTRDPRGAWELAVTSAQSPATTSGGIVVRLGRQDVPGRLERFLVAASSVVAARVGEVSYVDMRYSNGFAVGWVNGNTSLANKPGQKESRPDA